MHYLSVMIMSLIMSGMFLFGDKLVFTKIIGFFDPNSGGKGIVIGRKLWTKVLLAFFFTVIAEVVFISGQWSDYDMFTHLVGTIPAFFTWVFVFYNERRAIQFFSIVKRGVDKVEESEDLASEVVNSSIDKVKNTAEELKEGVSEKTASFFDRFKRNKQDEAEVIDVEIIEEETVTKSTQDITPAEPEVIDSTDDNQEVTDVEETLDLDTEEPLDLDEKRPEPEEVEVKKNKNFDELLKDMD